ncbi:MAG: phenylacetate--CoA ligase family protein [Planctomycetia bacterium]|nr:phenylacetate--CoA ligase family protein [Planctomycetia bacterium]
MLRIIDPNESYRERRRLERLDRAELEKHQLQRLGELLATILPHNAFYAEKLKGLRVPPQSLAEFRTWPLTTKEELETPGGLAANLTWPRERYVRFHQTSGTKGRPLVVLDTPQDWQRWIELWQYVLDAAEVRLGERALLAFSFGPFIGFWTAFDALLARGCTAIPSGGMSSRARLELLRTAQATALFCTPTYALHLAEVAQQSGIDLRKCGVRAIVVAGEPGGSIPTTRDRIEQVWNARVVDHAGATEVGPWGCADAERRGLNVIESEFIAEFISPETGLAAAPGDFAELVLTSLFRPGCPVIRYCTGDVVRPIGMTDRTRRGFALLEGGVLGRADDMLVVRGVNVFPSALEAVIREFPELGEFRATISTAGELDGVKIEVEDPLAQPKRIVEAFQMRLGLRVVVEPVPLGSLPRFEGKARRVVDLRKKQP